MSNKIKLTNGPAYTPKKMVFLLIGIFLMFVFGKVCPTWSTVTETGVQIIGVFLGWIVLSISGFGLMIPSLLAMFAMTQTDFYTSATIMSGLSGAVPMLCLFSMAVMYAFTGSRGGDVLIRRMLSRPFLSGHPLRFILMFNFAIMLLSMLTSIGGMLLGFAFITSIADAAGYERDSNFRRYMATSTFIICMCSSPVLPINSSVLLSMSVFSPALTEAGYTLDTACLIVTNLVVALLVTTIISLLAKPVFRVDLEPLKNIDVSSIANGSGDETEKPVVRLNKRQIISGIAVILAFTLSPLVQLIFPADSAIVNFVNSIDQVMLMILVLAVLEIIHIDGEPICDATEAFSKGVYWNVYICIATIALLSTGLSNADSGISAWIMQLFGTSFNNMSFPVLLLVVVVLCGVITQVFSNGVTIIIASSILAPFVATLALNGINAAVFPALIAQVCSMACLTAAGSGFVAMLLAEPGLKEKPNWIFFGGSVMMVVYFLVAIPVGILMGYLL